MRTSAIDGTGISDVAKLLITLEPRASSIRAKSRQKLLMAHENKIVSNPNFESILDRISQEGLSIPEALRELND